VNSLQVRCLRKNIHLSFGSNHVLRGIDLHVAKGTTASVIGPSGSGKSTLLRVMNSLIEPDQGDILLDGRSVLKDNPDELRQPDRHGFPAVQPLPAQDRG
jgi:polar amino acid transport system ATP-binding protein